MFSRRARDRTYDSAAEARMAAELDLQLAAGIILAWEPQVRFKLVVQGQEVCTYVLDFLIQHSTGRHEARELKGYSTGVGRLKWKLFCALFGQMYRCVLVRVPRAARRR